MNSGFGGFDQDAPTLEKQLTQKDVSQAASTLDLADLRARKWAKRRRALLIFFLSVCVVFVVVSAVLSVQVRDHVDKVFTADIERRRGEGKLGNQRDELISIWPRVYLARRLNNTAEANNLEARHATVAAEMAVFLEHMQTDEWRKYSSHSEELAKSTMDQKEGHENMEYLEHSWFETDFHSASDDFGNSLLQYVSKNAQSKWQRAVHTTRHYISDDVQIHTDNASMLAALNIAIAAILLFGLLCALLVVVPIVRKRERMLKQQVKSAAAEARLRLHRLLSAEEIQVIEHTSEPASIGDSATDGVAGTDGEKHVINLDDLEMTAQSQSDSYSDSNSASSAHTSDFLRSQTRRSGRRLKAVLSALSALLVAWCIVALVLASDALDAVNYMKNVAMPTVSSATSASLSVAEEFIYLTGACLDVTPLGYGSVLTIQLEPVDEWFENQTVSFASLPESHREQGTANYLAARKAYNELIDFASENLTALAKEQNKTLAQVIEPDPRMCVVTREMARDEALNATFRHNEAYMAELQTQVDITIDKERDSTVKRATTNVVFSSICGAAIIVTASLVFLSARSHSHNMQLMFTTKTWSLERITADDECNILFEKHAAKKFCNEMISFHTAFERTLWRVRGLSFVTAARLYFEFIRVGAPEEINISARDSRRVQSTFWRQSLDVLEDESDEANDLRQRFDNARDDKQWSIAQEICGTAKSRIFDEEGNVTLQSDAECTERLLQSFVAAYRENRKLIMENLHCGFVASAEFTQFEQERRERLQREFAVLQRQK